MKAASSETTINLVAEVARLRNAPVSCETSYYHHGFCFGPLLVDELDA
jgi:hypothetical protein